LGNRIKGTAKACELMTISLVILPLLQSNRLIC